LADGRIGLDSPGLFASAMDGGSFPFHRPKIESVVAESRYEAGREGFWLHQAMEQIGIGNTVVECVID